jgi:hypothetical protein
MKITQTEQRCKRQIVVTSRGSRKEISLHLATCYYGADLLVASPIKAVIVDYLRAPSSPFNSPFPTDDPKDTIETDLSARVGLGTYVRTCTPES